MEEEREHESPPTVPPAGRSYIFSASCKCKSSSSPRKRAVVMNHKHKERHSTTDMMEVKS